MQIISRICLSIVMFLALKSSANGQYFSQDDTLKFRTQQTKPYLNGQKFHYSLNLGTGVFAGSKYYSGAYTSISPNFSYLVTPKLNIEAGFSLVSGYNSGAPTSPVLSKTNSFQKTNQLFVYASGQYLLSDKLTLTSSVYKTLNSNSSPQMNPYFLDYKGANIGLNYKISDHVNLGAEFRYSNNGYNNSFMNQNEMGFNSPFQHNSVW